MVHRQAGRLKDAIIELERVAAIDEALQLPDFEAVGALLRKVRAELASR